MKYLAKKKKKKKKKKEKPYKKKEGKQAGVWEISVYNMTY